MCETESAGNMIRCDIDFSHFDYNHGYLLAKLNPFSGILYVINVSSGSKGAATITFLR